MKLYKIIWTDESIYNLNNMCNYIVYQFNDLAVSYKLYRKVIDSVLKLQYFPERYPDLSHYGITNKKYRRLRVGKIIILYRIDYFNRQSVYLTHISLKAKLFKSNVN